MDVMIDIETMSPRSNAAIASIGACAFDPKVIDAPQSIAQERKFSLIVDLGSQRGFDFDGSSIYWWLTQPSEARQALIPPNDPAAKVSLREALSHFTLWYQKVEGQRAWSYGSTFDLVIMQNAFTSLRMRNPIHYREQMCARTIISVSGVPRPQISGLCGHKALDDAILQAIWLQNAFHALYTGK